MSGTEERMRGVFGNPGGAVDKDEARAIVDLVRDERHRGLLRHTYAAAPDGNQDYEVFLAAYERQGEIRFAVVVSDEANFDVEDSGNREDAEAHYEETVRSLTGVHMGDTGGEPAWTETDVAGLPAGAVPPALELTEDLIEELSRFEERKERHDS